MSRPSMVHKWFIHDLLLCDSYILVVLSETAEYDWVTHIVQAVPSGGGQVRSQFYSPLL